MADIIYLSNGMDGDAFRVALNNNFNRLNEQLGGVADKGADTIYTDVFIESVEYVEGSVQVVAYSKGIEVYKLYDGDWVEVCKYNVDGSGMLSIVGDSAGVGYVTNEENKEHSEFNNLPVGYKSDGTMVVAGSIEIEGADPIHAVGWFKDGHLLKFGRVEIEDGLEVVAGMPVYVDDKNTGWTIEKPIESGQLVQVIGFISDDKKYIDINLMAWCIAV